MNLELFYGILAALIVFLRFAAIVWVIGVGVFKLSEIVQLKIDHVNSLSRRRLYTVINRLFVIMVWFVVFPLSLGVLIEAVSD